MKALISVSDKSGIVEFAKELEKIGIEIISTGGTYKKLKEEGVTVTEISDYTVFPECLDGRVKTLHPKVHAGILAMRSNPSHMEQLKELNVDTIDFVIVNLYPFKQTILKEGVKREEAIENIDIGGPTMLRSAAKNYQDVTVVTDPNDYEKVLKELKENGQVSLDTKFYLMNKVFEHTASYDAMICKYLKEERKDETLPQELTYVAGSSNYGEPVEIIENEDGTRTYIWEKYNCNVGEKIEDLVIRAEIDPDTRNGTTLQVKSVIEPDKELIGLSSIELRTATIGIEIVNLSSHSLYKETEDKIIEVNDEIKYKVTYQNKTDYTMPDFQLLDILPYNGDGRGTAYNGTYTLKDVKVTQTSGGSSVENDNLSLFTTTDIEARKITPKYEGIGNTEEEGGIWKEKEIGEEINEAVTVLAIKGEIEANIKVEMEITLKTSNNRSGDVYSNSVTAQTSKETEVITSTNTKTRVVRRQISGMIWYDINENGIKDEEEPYASRIEVGLKKEDGSQAVDINGNEIPNVLTNERGEYVFNNLPKGKYVVLIQTDEVYTLTEAYVGSNQEINSKFEETEEGDKQSGTITNLDGLQSPEIIEGNINAGLVIKDAKIIVKYLEEDDTPETDEDNEVVKEQEEITEYEKDGVMTKYKLGDRYTTEATEIEDYLVIRNSGNTSGTLNTEEIVVTYYYVYNKQNIEVTKIWNDNNDSAGKRPISIKITLKDGNNTVEEKVISSANKADSDESIWREVFEDIPIYRENGERISYTVDESENEGTLDSYIKTIEGTRITNTFTQNTEKTEVEVIKKWEDNGNRAEKRPSSLVLILKKEAESDNGEIEYQEVARATINGTDNQGENSNEWRYIFGNLSKYDENNDEIKYVVEEEIPKFYNSDIQETEENTYEIINTFKVPDETISVEVTKIWNDNNNRAEKRPEEVTLVLSGNGEEYKVTLNKANQVEGQENIWKGMIENLPKYDENANEIEYTLSEEDLNNIFYTEENTTIDQQRKTITNKFEVPEDKIEIEVHKKWEDNNNELGRRPENVTLYLSGNNQEYNITLTEANKNTEDESIWSGTIGNLPKYDVNGNKIRYTIDERPIASEFYTKSGIDQESKTVTNKFGIPTETIQIGVTKIWEDNENRGGKRPENIVLQIKEKKTGDVLTEQIVHGNKTTNEGWRYIFEVPKYNEESEEVEYEIGERSLNSKFYPEEEIRIDQENRTITNVFVVPDEKVSVEVRKIWEDDNNRERKRPESVTIVVTGNGQTYRQELNKSNEDSSNSNNWVYTFNDLPKYDENGDEINYTIDEEELENRYYEKENVNQTEKTITNVSKYGKVTVHYYIMNRDGTTTTTKVPDMNGNEIEDVIIEGKQGESYTSSEANDVQSNYELVLTPSNATGTIRKEETEVIYYYRLKTPNITNQTIEKTGTDRITEADQEVRYNITYNAEVTEYIGNAEVTVVDTLPYEIDEEKSELDGGTYDKEAKTITWKENITDVNSYSNNGVVAITKNIKVVYIGLDMNEEKV